MGLSPALCLTLSALSVLGGAYHIWRVVKYSTVMPVNTVAAYLMIGSVGVFFGGMFGMFIIDHLIYGSA